jgi:predicted nucleotidyltransferase
MLCDVFMEKWTQASIIENVQEQIRRRISQKYNWKRTVLFSIVQLKKKFYRIVFSRRHNAFHTDLAGIKSDIDLGVDEFGRDVARCLMEYANLLVNRGVKLHTLVVLGSRAKGRGKPESDVDIMVIASNLPGKKMPEFANLPQKILNIRQQLLLADGPLFIGVEPSSCCSKEEFLQWLRRFKVVALDAIYYGKVIYDDGFWKHVVQTFKKIEQKYGLDNTKLKEMLFVL